MVNIDWFHLNFWIVNKSFKYILLEYNDTWKKIVYLSIQFKSLLVHSKMQSSVNFVTKINSPHFECNVHHKVIDNIQSSSKIVPFQCMHNWNKFSILLYNLEYFQKKIHVWRIWKTQLGKTFHKHTQHITDFTLNIVSKQNQALHLNLQIRIFTINVYLYVYIYTIILIKVNIKA